MATKNGLATRFSYLAMQNLMSYLLTQNHESQAVAIDANANDIQTTGGKGVTINGVQCILAADAALDISAEPPYAAWAVSTGYTTAGAVSEVTHIDPDGQIRHYVCIKAHTSYATAATVADSDEPMVGANWKTYWRELKVWAETAYADSIPYDDTNRYYLVCALSDGTLRIFKAYHPTTFALRIPAYDPTRYVAIGLITTLVQAAQAAAGVVGTWDWADAHSTTTWQQLTGYIFPDVSLLEVN